LRVVRVDNVMFLCAAYVLAILPVVVSQPYSIDDYGAVSGVDTHAQAVVNGQAFTAAIVAANASATRRSVLVPAGKVYSFLPSTPFHDSLTDVSIYVEGTLNVSTANFWEPGVYPGYPNSPWNPLGFSNCVGLRLVSTTGKGLLNGRGNLWWWFTILVADHRANLLEVDTCTNFELAGVTLLNSASWHMFLSGQTNATVRGVTVLVDIEDQLQAYRYIGGASASATLPQVLLAAERIGPTSAAEAAVWAAAGGSPLAARQAAGDPGLLAARAAALPPLVRAQPWYNAGWDITPPVPMVWALNTDGIDFSGQGITVSNCSITNFDDSVCVKPSVSADGSAAGCTSGVDISDIRVTYGVGVSMGSVPPDATLNCIDGVAARRLHFESPLKAMYIKPNPRKSDPGGDFGRIANVLYEDVEVRDALWWAIWVGTQQQHQPGGGGTDCPFIFPLLNSTCPSDPQVTLANITLRRVNIYGGVFSPGVIMANQSNPGTGFVWDAVVAHNASTFPETGYLVRNIKGTAMGGTSPVPPGFVQG
jgi:polygalacturonase